MIRPFSYVTLAHRKSTLSIGKPSKSRRYSSNSCTKEISIGNSGECELHLWFSGKGDAETGIGVSSMSSAPATILPAALFGSRPKRWTGLVWATDFAHHPMRDLPHSRSVKFVALYRGSYRQCLGLV